MAGDDAALFVAARGGDTDAFETLVRRHLPAAYLVALGATGERADAEDVVQDALVRCHERLGDCRDPARFRPWFLRIVRNRAHNVREYLAVRRAEPLEDLDAAGAGGSDADLARAELRRALLAALAGEPEVRRQVLLLHDLSGFAHAEIAATLGISVLMSRHHLSVGRRRARERLRRAGYSGGTI